MPRRLRRPITSVHLPPAANAVRGLFLFDTASQDSRFLRQSYPGNSDKGTDASRCLRAAVPTLGMSGSM